MINQLHSIFHLIEPLAMRFTIVNQLHAAEEVLGPKLTDLESTSLTAMGQCTNSVAEADCIPLWQQLAEHSNRGQEIDKMKSIKETKHRAPGKRRSWVARSLVAHRSAIHGKSKRALRKSAKESLQRSIRSGDEV